jgi:hypothetical protein
MDLDLQCVSVDPDPYSDPATQIIKWILTDPDLQPLLKLWCAAEPGEKKFSCRAAKSYSMSFKIHHELQEGRK